MSDIQKRDREKKIEKQTGPLESVVKSYDLFASPDDDNSPTMRLPAMPRLSLPPELRSTPMLFSPSTFTMDAGWVAEEATWILPAISKTALADRQSRASTSSATQGKGKKQGAQSYVSLAVEMVKSSGIYAIGALMSPLVSLILTPFLAQHLSSNDYGGLSVSYTIVDLVTVITQLGLSPAFFRAYNSDYENPRDRVSVLAMTVSLLILASIPVALLMVLVAPELSELLFNSASFSSSVALAAGVIVMENLALPGTSWFRAEKRPIPYTILSFVSLLVVLFSNLFLVGVLHMGVNGALIAKGAGFASTIVITLPLIFLRVARQRGFRIRFDILHSMLTFGIPTIFSDIAAWVLQLSDRYLLTHFGSLSETARYSVAYTLGGVLSPVLLAPWGLAWVPIMYSVAKRDDAPHIFKLVFRWWSSILLFAAFGLSLLSTVILDTLFPVSYRAADPVVPIITLSTMLQGVWYIFMIGVNIRRKTILEFIYVVIAAVVNLLLNLFLIPWYGAVGAAVATLIAYILLTAVSYIVNQRIYPVGFEVGSFSFKLLVGVAIYVGSILLTYAQSPLIRWSVSIVALLVYGAILLSLSGIPPRKIIALIANAQTLIKKELAKPRA
ncbi:MAG TPA: lipopolysaccharide biosynthesis protein [Ktedonobacteraceae bacterium]|jgi:O-antigen/teichoic acid export membrane protein